MTKRRWHKAVTIGAVFATGGLVLGSALASGNGTPRPQSMPQASAPSATTPLVVWKDATQTLYVKDAAPDTMRVCATNRLGQIQCVTVDELREPRN